MTAMSETKKAALSGKYAAYPEYKDSGVEWLDEIPTHWKTSKIKYIAPFQVGWTPPTKNDDNFIGDNIWVNISDLKGKFVKNSSKKISDKAAQEASMDITPKGSLLYSFKLSVGAVSFAECDLYTNEAIASFLDSAELPLAYLYYVLPKFVIENASTNIYGARILNQELIRNALLIVPTYDEANKIAAFLDHETANIDTLIEKQKKLIELLKEKRQAVISHAVTKGLNPDAPMKDSGVEWLGEVPEHWIVLNIQRVLHKIEQGSSPVAQNRTPQQEEFGVLKISSVKKGVFHAKESKTLDSITQYESRFRVTKGDLLVTRANTPSLVADACVVNQEPSFPIMMCDLIYRLVTTDKVDNHFLCMWLLSDFGRMQVEADARGSSMTMAKVSQGHIKAWLTVLPPLSEQKEIVAYLEHANKQFSQLTYKAEKAIELMRERRTALISAAVTGKIDVRHWVAPTTNSDTNEAQHEVMA